MMKKFLLPVALAALCLLLIAGCTTTTSPVGGLFYTDVSAGTNVGSGDAVAGKKGVACATGVLGFAWGDATIATAKRNGGITKIAYVDHTYTGVLFLYAKYCTVVVGE